MWPSDAADEALDQLTTTSAVGIQSNMPASLLLYERHVLSSNSFAELRIWQVPTAVRGSAHGFKYSLALIVSGECVLRFDNEAGKGDHRHLGETELSYEFVDPTRLLTDFWAEVDRWQRNEK